MLLHRNNDGYTLVELLIAIVLGVILMSAAYATYISQNRSYVTQESVSEVNTQSKIAHDLISNDIRSAGFGSPDDLNVDPINGYNTIATPIDGNNNLPDALTLLGGFRRVGTLWPSPTPGCPSVVPLGDNVVRIVYDGTEGPNTTDRRFLTVDGVHFFQVQNCNIAAGTTRCASQPITLDRPVPQDIPLADTNGDGCGDTGRPVYLVEDTTYCVDPNQFLRRIRRNADPVNCVPVGTSTDDVIAENVEDLQFAYAVDADDDGQIDDQNGNAQIDPGDFLDAGAFANPATIRAVRVNVLARTDRPDPNIGGQGNPPALIENRILPATNDNFRRRWWQTMVKMRNQ